MQVNFARVSVALPMFAAVLVATRGGAAFSGVTTIGAAWLFLSVVSSYAMADSIFFTAARRIGVTTALSIGSMYPLWAALWGTLVGGEPFGWGRAVGTCLAVAGIVWLVRLSGTTDPERPAAGRAAGVALAIATSILWAANSVSVKRGAQGLELPQVNTIRYGIGVLLLLPQMLRERGAGRAVPARRFVPLLPAIVCDAVIGSVCYVYGLSHTDLAVGATLTSLAPPISVPVGLAVGEETWSVPRFGAVVTTVAGVVLLVMP